MVEQCNSDYGTEEQLWWNSATVIMEKKTVMLEQWKGDGGTVEQ